jgi:hypothetical protein
MHRADVLGASHVHGQTGVSPAYVQEQLGHASIELTVGANRTGGAGRCG